MGEPQKHAHIHLVRRVERDLEKAQKPAKDTFSRHKAMSQLTRRTVTAYETTVDKIFKEILRFLSKEVVPGTKLKKSDDDAEGMYGFASDVDWPDADMVAFASQEDDSDSPFSARRFQAEKKLSLLTPTQLETIKQIVRDYHSAFAVGTFGPDSIPPQEVQRLMDAGILPQDLAYVFQPAPGERPPDAERITDMAFQYGANLGDPRSRGSVIDMGYDKFKEHVDQTRQELNPVERQAMAFARYHGGEHVRGMGDRLATQVGTMILNEDAEQRRRYMGAIRRELEGNIDRRQTWRKLASEIGHATEDWSRDMQRLAATEKQFAMQEGTARRMTKGRDPDEIRVAKIPSPDACKDCVRLHLTAGEGSPPRIFKMSDLQANGTNVGRKRADWQPTVGPVHPWCGCELVEVPEGWAFDEEGDMVPEIMLKKGDRLDVAWDSLSKGEDRRSHMTHGDAVPANSVVVRVADPQRRQVIEKILEQAPSEIFDSGVGVTLITTDSPRAQNPLEEHDFAYWTANEIRINQTLPIARLPRVLRHELGHSLNVYLMKKLGGAQAVRQWHDRLWEVSQAEGWVSDYAKKLPIENAAEVTRMYIFERPKLMLNFPKQYAFVHRAYRAIFERAE